MGWNPCICIHTRENWIQMDLTQEKIGAGLAYIARFCPIPRSARSWSYHTNFRNITEQATNFRNITEQARQQF